MEEYDRPSAEFEFSVEAKVTKKGNFDIDTSVAAKAVVKFPYKGNYCGYAHTSFFDPYDTWLYFPNFGARVRISREP